MKKTLTNILIIGLSVVLGLFMGMAIQGQIDSAQFEHQQKMIDEYKASQEQNQRRFEVLCGRHDELPSICQNLDGTERLPVQYE